MTNTNRESYKGNTLHYRREYRSYSLTYFVKTLLSVIIMGKSPAESTSYYRIRKTNK